MEVVADGAPRAIRFTAGKILIAAGWTISLCLPAAASGLELSVETRARSVSEWHDLLRSRLFHESTILAALHPRLFFSARKIRFFTALCRPEVGSYYKVS